MHHCPVKGCNMGKSRSRAKFCKKHQKRCEVHQYTMMLDEICEGCEQDREKKREADRKRKDAERKQREEELERQREAKAKRVGQKKKMERLEKGKQEQGGKENSEG
jgi:hypothetical protein